MQNIEQELRTFVIETFLFGDAAQAPAREESFLEKGIIDSTGVLELVQFVEEKFGIRLADEELIPENLDSLARLSAFVQSRMGVAATA